MTQNVIAELLAGAGFRSGAYLLIRAVHSESRSNRYPHRKRSLMSIAIRNEGAKVNSNINVTPMVDVMLVLLIIFMVITPMLQKGVSVDLGESQQSGADAGC